jgi:hypothetical protein
MSDFLASTCLYAHAIGRIVGWVFPGQIVLAFVYLIGQSQNRLLKRGNTLAQDSELRLFPDAGPERAV